MKRRPRNPPRKFTLAELHTELCHILGHVEEYFTGPVKLTLVCRTPWLPDGGVLVSSDTPEEAIAEIKRLAAKPPLGTENEGKVG